MLPIRELIERKIVRLTLVSRPHTIHYHTQIALQKVRIYWMCKRDNISSFESGLRQLVRILEPLAHACQFLKSSKATASDVYHFWLAVLATYECYIQ